MHTEVFRLGDHEKKVRQWWLSWHGVDCGSSILSRYGVAVLERDRVLAVSHLYPAQTASLCFIGFTVRDPDLSLYRAGKALKLLLSAAEDAIRQIRYDIVYTQFDSLALQKLVKRRGYHEGSQVLEYWKDLKK